MNHLNNLIKFFKIPLFVKCFFFSLIIFFLTNYVINSFWIFWNLDVMILSTISLIIFICLFYVIRKTLEILNLYNKLFLSILLTAFVFRSFVLDFVWIRGESMEPAIKNHSIAIVDKISYGINLPDFVFPFGELGYRKICLKCKIQNLKKNDIIIFDLPDPVLKKRKWIKRIVAQEGDVYEFKDSFLWINGVVFWMHIDFLPEEHSTFIFELPRELKKYSENNQYYFLNGIGKKGMVPKDSFLVIGDNTKKSRDSRVFGFIPKDRVLGKLLYVF